MDRHVHGEGGFETIRPEQAILQLPAAALIGPQSQSGPSLAKHSPGISIPA
jgi:hypothetical protein